MKTYIDIRRKEERGINKWKAIRAWITSRELKKDDELRLGQLTVKAYEEYKLV